ncbi:RhuM family protein [Saccharospirillum impatiens]|uniref:RhuM family protein n=1 Tax=Saccharospirillum impatiens TaxID=169438 RepID=UPI00048B6CE5|nr:RhuM family protein [Saccharospirillum impatiens]
MTRYTKRRKQIFLQDWQAKLDEFLRFNDRNVLSGTGSVSKQAADSKASQEYDTFSETRRNALEQKGAEETIRTLEAITKLDSGTGTKKS